MTGYRCYAVGVPATVDVAGDYRSVEKWLSEQYGSHHPHITAIGTMDDEAVIIYQGKVPLWVCQYVDDCQPTVVKTPA